MTASPSNIGYARERVVRALELAVEGRDAEAVFEVEEASRMAPGAPWMQVARSAVLREAGRRADALRAADEAVRLTPDDPRAHRVRSAALLAAGRLAEARAAAALAARLAPDDAFVMTRLGDLAIDRDPAEAERYYRRGLRLDPTSAAARAGLARALRRLGRRGEAELEYERAAQADPAIRELRRRAGALLAVILQASVGTLLAILVLGWVPDVVAVHRPDARGAATVLMAALAAAGPIALLGWAAARIRRLGREAPVAPEVREELRDIAAAVKR